MGVGMAAAAVVGATAAGLTAATAPFVLPALRRVCLPFVPATCEQLANVLAALSHCPPGAVVDLGSGDGRVVFAAAAQTGRRAAGVELNSLLWLYSKLRARRLGLAHSAHFYRRDFWRFDIREYSTAIIFGTETLMEHLQPKLDRELRRGSSVITCRFQMQPEASTATWAQLLSIGVGIDQVWLYRKQ